MKKKSRKKPRRDRKVSESRKRKKVSLREAQVLANNLPVPGLDAGVVQEVLNASPNRYSRPVSF